MTEHASVPLPLDGLSPGMGEVRVVDRRVILVVDGSVSQLTAADIVAALQGAREVGGFRLACSPARSCPETLFRPAPAQVGVRLTREAGQLVATPVVRFGAIESNLPFPDDHALVGSDWHPIEAESLARLRAWQATADDAVGPVSVERVYAALGPDLVTDQLSDADVWALGPDVLPPPPLDDSLRPFQMTGFRWLFARAEAGAGSILADGMGSGKTIQTIAVLAARRALGRPASLIAVPTTLLENWSREIMRFAPALRFYMHHGSGRAGTPKSLRDANLDLVVTSHETAARDSGLLGMLEWDVLVVDEAQRIRNPDGLVRSELRHIRRVSSLLLTGTPLENRPMDLWSLADFVEPGYLGTRVSFEDGLGASPSDLRAAVRPLLLRRPPEIVAADMPDLLSQDVHLAMYEEEAKAYDRILEDASRVTGSILAVIARLRSFAAWPTEAGPGSPSLPSAKFDRTIEMLEESLSDDEKVVVFCWFRRAAGEIVAAVETRLTAPAFGVDGSTPVERRQPIIDEFSATQGGAVLVLNTRAAGVGLNVQAGSRVIHYTLEWNPAAEDQATARVYRSGQTKHVTRHRLIYDGSIDEVMVDTMDRKRALFEQAIPEGDLAKGELARMMAEILAKRPSRHSESA